jgi:hypothetical protein
MDGSFSFSTAPLDSLRSWRTGFAVQATFLLYTLQLGLSLQPASQQNVLCIMQRTSYLQSNDELETPLKLALSTNSASLYKSVQILNKYQDAATSHTLCGGTRPLHTTSCISQGLQFETWSLFTMSVLFCDYYLRSSHYL